MVICRITCRIKSFWAQIWFLLLREVFVWHNYFKYDQKIENMTTVSAFTAPGCDKFCIFGDFLKRKKHLLNLQMGFRTRRVYIWSWKLQTVVIKIIFTPLTSEQTTSVFKAADYCHIIKSLNLCAKYIILQVTMTTFLHVRPRPLRSPLTFSARRDKTLGVDYGATTQLEHTKPSVQRTDIVIDFSTKCSHL